RVPEHELSSMVGSIANAPPRVQRRPLRIEEVEWRRAALARKCRASGQTRCIKFSQTRGFVVGKTGKHVVHGLCGCVGGGSEITARCAAQIIFARGPSRRSETEIPCCSRE